VIALLASVALAVQSSEASADAASDYARRGYYSFGTLVASAGDVNGDGTPDLIVGDPSGYGPVLWIISGKDGSVLRAISLPVGWGWQHFVEGGADLDGDGVPDVVVVSREVVAAEPCGPSPREATPQIRFISGKTGEVMRCVEIHAGCGCGGRDSVHIIADFDRDGVPDVAVLCASAGEKRGAIVIYSGRTGARLTSIPIVNECEAKAGAFAEVKLAAKGGGRAFAVLLDVADMNCVAAHTSTGIPTGTDLGCHTSLRLYSTASAHPLWERLSIEHGYVWGRAALTQVGGPDGGSHLVVGYDEKVDVVDTVSGKVLNHFERERKDIDGLGRAVAALGDIDHDQVPDFAYSAYDTGMYSGRVVARSGKDGKTIWSVESDLNIDDVHHLGEELAAIGDIDGDGICDLAVASDMRPCGVEPGVAEVLSGKNGALLFRFTRNGDGVEVSREPVGAQRRR
jgi:hypothetical protein